MSVRSELTRRLVVSLKEQGNSVVDMATMCGVSRQTIYDWIKKDQGAQNDHLDILIELTGVKLTKIEERLF